MNEKQKLAMAFTAGWESGSGSGVANVPIWAWEDPALVSAFVEGYDVGQDMRSFVLSSFRERNGMSRVTYVRAWKLDFLNRRLADA